MSSNHHNEEDRVWTRRFGRGRRPWEDIMSPDDEHRGHGHPPFGRRGGRGGRPGFAGGEPTGSFFGRGPRAARGDIRAAILALLAEEPMHGYQVIKELGTRTGGVWKPSPGSVYPTLQHMEEEGVVAGRDEDGKRVFELTEAGRTELATRAAGRPTPWDEVGGEVDSELVDLRDIARQVAVAVRQVAHVGSPGQVDEARRILTDARRALYRILADEGPAPEAAGTGNQPGEG
jgi:DNA-binding PadR family transcriptional regulator